MHALGDGGLRDVRGRPASRGSPPVAVHQRRPEGHGPSGRLELHEVAGREGTPIALLRVGDHPGMPAGERAGGGARDPERGARRGEDRLRGPPARGLALREGTNPDAPLHQDAATPQVPERWRAACSQPIQEDRNRGDLRSVGLHLELDQGPRLAGQLAKAKARHLALGPGKPRDQTAQRSVRGGTMTPARPARPAQGSAGAQRRLAHGRPGSEPSVHHGGPAQPLARRAGAPEPRQDLRGGDRSPRGAEAQPGHAGDIAHLAPAVARVRRVPAAPRYTGRPCPPPCPASSHGSPSVSQPGASAAPWSGAWPGRHSASR